MLPRVGVMVFLGALMALAALLAGEVRLAAGVPFGLAVALFNYRLVQGAVARSWGLEPVKAHALVLRYALLRMVIALAALLAAMPFGPAAVLGVGAGLVTQMLSYFVDAWQILRRRG